MDTSAVSRRYQQASSVDSSGLHMEQKVQWEIGPRTTVQSRHWFESPKMRQGLEAECLWSVLSRCQIWNMHPTKSIAEN